MRRQQTIAAVLYVPRQRRGPDGPGVQRPHAICAARSPNFHIDDAAKSQLNDTRIGGLSYQQGTRTLWATGRHLRHKTGAPYITFLFSSLYLSRHDRGSLSCVVCRCVIRCTSSCAITTHSYHIPGRVRRWLPGKPSHASEQGPMGPHGRVGSPLSGLPSYGTTPRIPQCLAQPLIPPHARSARSAAQAGDRGGPACAIHFALGAPAWPPDRRRLAWRDLVY